VSLAPAVERRSLYHSHLGVFGFQADGAARVYLDTSRPDLQAKLALWSTGIGKTHLAMLVICLLIEDGLLDHAIVTCEIGKLLDWKEDIERFTDLTVGVYHGDKTRRAKIRANMPQVIISTFETIKADGVIFKRSGKKQKVDVRSKPDPGPLVDVLSGKRTFWVYDEMSAKLSSDRTSQNYLAHQWVLTMLRKTGSARALGLTANAFDRDPEGSFNMSRILLPKPPCTVAEFEERYVAYRDELTRKVKKWQNLSEADCDPNTVPLTRLLAPLVMVKLKTDADVRDQFPKQVEEAMHVTLSDAHYDFYERIEGFFNDLPEEDQRVGFTLLRQLVGHPMSLLRSQGKYAREIVNIVGAQTLSAMGSKKTDETIEYVKRRYMAGEQAVLFTFFGQSILPILHEELLREKMTVSINHGQMTANQRQESKAQFRAGDTGIFLTSDAGARGLNLPEALVVINYEMPLTWALYDQRINRVHRIDSDHPSVTCQSVIADFTLEEPIANMVLTGNEHQDSLIADWNKTVLDDEDDGAGAIPAALRRKLLDISRSKRTR
jgi:SNF2 family DNA or RNA helicase